MLKKKTIVRAGLLLLTTVSVSTIYLNQNPNTSTANAPTQQIQSNTIAQITSSAITQKITIRDKMLNSIDYFENVQGTFERYIAALNLQSTITYTVDMQTGYSKEIIQDCYPLSPNRNRTLEKTYFPNEAYLVEVDHRMKGYQIFNTMSREDILKNVQKQKQQVAAQTFSDSTGNIVQATYERNDPNYLMAPDSIFPKQIAMSFLSQMNLWEIVDEETLFERNVVIIEGEFEDYFKNKYNAETFKLWVDSETGILLKYEAYTTTGDVKDYIRTQQISINQNIAKNYTATNEIDTLSIPSTYTNMGTIQISELQSAQSF